MASIEIWKKLKHFSVDEDWGDPSRINEKLILKLDLFREYVDRPIVISCGTQGVHKKKSEHYKGNAVDCVIDAPEITPMELIIGALKFGFTGVGYYKGWQLNGKDVHGLHLDVRAVDDMRARTWIGEKITYKHKGQEKTKTKYYRLTQNNLFVLDLF